MAKRSSAGAKKATKAGKVEKSASPAATGKPMWHGRFSRGPAALTEAFVESLSFDNRMYRHDICGSIAHARMLEKVGLIKKSERAAIEKGLSAIADEIASGKFEFAQADEDIHMAVEAALIRKIGEPGKKLHTARSRNDQVAVDLRLYLRDAIDGRLLPALDAVQKAFVEMARRDGMAVVPGFTHMQHAQPVCAGAMILAYVEMLERDRERLIDCRKRIDWCPLGACALAGTTLKTDREFTAKELGFANVTRNSIDSVSDRDFAIELVFVLSMIAMHLSRWAEEWILWCSQEFGFLEPDEAYCTGSSIMPQKRNPDVLELIRGKAGGVYGQLLALLTMLKGLPLTYNRDMQDDKRYVFDALDTVGLSLEISAAMIAGSRLKADAMESKLNEGFLEATALAEYLVGKGMAFRQSHQVVGQTVAYAERNGKRLAELTLEELTTLAGGMAIGRDVYTVLDSRKLVFAYRSLGSAGVSELKAQLRYWDAVTK